MDAHLGCFLILTTVNNAAVYRYLSRPLLLVVWGPHLEAEWLDQMVLLCYCFGEVPHGFYYDCYYHNRLGLQFVHIFFLDATMSVQ